LIKGGGEGSRGGEIIGHVNGKPVYKKHLNIALKAHNGRKESPTFNQGYNDSKGLGDSHHRGLIAAAEQSKHGILPTHKKMSMGDVLEHIRTSSGFVANKE